MVDWLKYLVRLLAALFLCFLTLALLILAVGSKDGRVFGLVGAAICGLAGLVTWPRRPNAWRSDPPTERQLAFARDLGIAVPRRISKGELSDLISQAKAVRDAF